MRAAPSTGILGTVSAHSAREWLSLPELAERFGAPVGKVRRMLEERQLLALKIDGALRVPAEFVDPEGPLSELRGTIILLTDNGFSDDEAVDWLLSHEDSLDASPIAALRAGRKAEVRRVAQALA